MNNNDYLEVYMVTAVDKVNPQITRIGGNNLCKACAPIWLKVHW